MKMKNNFKKELKTKVYTYKFYKKNKSRNKIKCSLIIYVLVVGRIHHCTKIFCIHLWLGHPVLVASFLIT